MKTLFDTRENAVNQHSLGTRRFADIVDLDSQITKLCVSLLSLAMFAFCFALGS